MADTTPPVTTTTPNVDSPRANRLEETKLDAEFNFLERLRQDEAKRKHEAAKADAFKNKK